MDTLEDLEDTKPAMPAAGRAMLDTKPTDTDTDEPRMRQVTPRPRGRPDINLDTIINVLFNVADNNAPLDLSEFHLKELCQRAGQLFLKQPTLLRLRAPVTVVGDIHGQYADLLAQLKQCGYPPVRNYLFLGDYVDRGKRSIECISLLLAYKLKFPENIFLLRGNHECSSINRLYGFYDECKRRFSLRMWKSFTDCFNCLPFSALIEDTILCMHGGISPDLHDLKQLESISRPLEVPDSGMLCDLLWCDPDEDAIGWGTIRQSGWSENDRGVAYTFGIDTLKKFMDKHSLSLVVRAHQVVEDGYEFFAKRKLVTLFSAPNYCGEFDNAAAVMHIDDDLTCSFAILSPWQASKPPLSARSPRKQK